PPAPPCPPPASASSQPFCSSASSPSPTSASASPKSAPTLHPRVLNQLSWLPPSAPPSAATLHKCRIPFLPPTPLLSPAAKSIFPNVPAATAISNQARVAQPLP